MKKFVFKLGGYVILLLICLEIIVRFFHLAKDTPLRYIDASNVEKWQPNQEGYSVTGNRNQNFSKYRINNSGFNSFREFIPTRSKYEVALVGDSFFQGFHQNYNNSIAKKIEKQITSVEVYTYAYAGYDFADQLHLINAYKKEFDLINEVIIYLNFSEDLNRGAYEVIQDRIKLQRPLFLTLQKSKLLVYLNSIGFFAPLKRVIVKIIGLLKGGYRNNANQQVLNTIDVKRQQQKREILCIENFKKLVNQYNYNTDKYTLLLNSATTPLKFLNFLNNQNYNYIDFKESFGKATKPTTLIYDQHWNNYGRTIIANLIIDYLDGKTNNYNY